MPSQSENGAARETILVLRFSSLGDILLTAPALRALRKRFPESHIDFMVARGYEDAASLIPGPDRVLTFDKRATGELSRVRTEISRRYSIIVDLQSSLRSSYLRTFSFPILWVKAKRYRFRRWLLVKTRVNSYRGVTPVPLRYTEALSTMGVEDDGQGLDLRIPDTAREWASAELAGFGEFVALCPGARHRTKKWPLDRWRDLAVRLREQGRGIILLGAPEERIELESIGSAVTGGRVYSDVSIPQAAALLSRSACAVSNDSGLMHLACGVGTPVVAIFGPTVEEFGFYPFRAKAEVLDHRLPCRPCSAMGSDACPQKHFRCMLDTDVTRVMAAVSRLTPVL